MAQKKRGVKSYISQEKLSLPTEDWNSRFWIDKIPEYKPKSAIYPDRGNIRIRNGSQILPKILSAHELKRKTSPVSQEPETPIILKPESQSATKIEIARITKKDNNRLDKRNSVMASDKRNSVMASDKRNSVMTSDKRNSVMASVKSFRRLIKSESEELKYPNRISICNLPGRISSEHLKRVSIRSSNTKPLSPLVVAKNQTPLIPINLPAIQINKISDIEDLFDTYEIKEINSDSDDDELGITQFKQMTIDIMDTIIEIFLNQVSESLVIEAFKEMVSAALVLFSSSVLDKYIQEVLGEMIPKIAKEVYREYKDIEYIDFQELTTIIYHLNLMFVASNIMKDYSCLLPLEEIANESIFEEKSFNTEIINTVCNHLVDCLIEEEWVEVLAEDEINNLRLEHIWIFFPPNLQKEINKSQFHQIVDRISEGLYFDILNEIVGGVWVESIIWYCINNETEEHLELVMPVKKKCKSTRKL